MRSFDEAFKEFNLTPEERQELIFHLAFLRAFKTFKALSR